MHTQTHRHKNLECTRHEMRAHKSANTKTKITHIRTSYAEVMKCVPTRQRNGAFGRYARVNVLRLNCAKGQRVGWGCGGVYVPRTDTVSARTHTHTHTHIHMHTYRQSIYTHTHTYTCARAHPHTPTHTRTCAHTHTHTRTCACRICGSLSLSLVSGPLYVYVSLSLSLSLLF